MSYKTINKGRDCMHGRRLGNCDSCDLEETIQLLANTQSELAAARAEVERLQPSFQQRVEPWLLECFGEIIAADTIERNHRFLEESLELVQACGCTADEAHKLVDYVYGRPIGEKQQEVGGVMVTLAALCRAQQINMHEAGEIELSRISQPEIVERIREKQKRKPAMSPLPGVYPERATHPAPFAVLDDEADIFWDTENPEFSYDSIDELVNDAWENGADIGTEFEVMRAQRLPNIRVRLVWLGTSGEDMDGETSYEIIDAARPASEGQQNDE